MSHQIVKHGLSGVRSRIFYCFSGNNIGIINAHDKTLNDRRQLVLSSTCGVPVSPFENLFHSRQHAVPFSSSTSTTSTTSHSKQPRRRRRRQHQQQDDDDGFDDNSSSRRSRFLDERNVPSYKEFVHRHTVLSLYRGYLRSIRVLRYQQKQQSLSGSNSRSSMADELLNEIRREFRAQQHEEDIFQRQRAIADGHRRYDELRGLTGEATRQQSNNENKNSPLQQQDADSWMNIVDPDDERGRVGDGWPWMKK